MYDKKLSVYIYIYILTHANRTAINVLLDRARAALPSTRIFNIYAIYNTTVAAHTTLFKFTLSFSPDRSIFGFNIGIGLIRTYPIQKAGILNSKNMFDKSKM